jgi:hypothetical protein
LSRLENSDLFAVLPIKLNETPFMILCFIPSALLVAATFSLSTAYAGEIQVKDGQTIGFLGDSITAAGARSGGYCHLFIQALKAEGITATPIYKGIGGHKSNQMLHPPFAPLRSGPKAASRPSRQKQIPGNQLILTGTGLCRFT